MAYRAAGWALSAVYAVMWVGGVVSYAVKPSAAVPWAAPAFLLIAAALMLSFSREKRLLLCYAAAGLVIEWAGVHTGAPFGVYRYTPALGPAVQGVPFAISCAWLILLAFARDAGSRFTSHRWSAAIAGAAVMTGADLLIDPVATRVLNYWIWEPKGIWFGVPLSNFAGWFIAGMALLYAGKWPVRRSLPVLLTGASVVLFFAVIALYRISGSGFRADHSAPASTRNEVTIAKTMMATAY